MFGVSAVPSESRQYSLAKYFRQMHSSRDILVVRLKWNVLHIFRHIYVCVYYLFIYLQLQNYGNQQYLIKGNCEVGIFVELNYFIFIMVIILLYL